MILIMYLNSRAGMRSKQLILVVKELLVLLVDAPKYACEGVPLSSVCLHPTKSGTKLLIYTLSDCNQWNTRICFNLLSELFPQPLSCDPFIFLNL